MQCNILYYTVLYCTVPYYTILCYAMLRYATLRYATLRVHVDTCVCVCVCVCQNVRNHIKAAGRNLLEGATLEIQSLGLLERFDLLCTSRQK